MNKKDDQNFPSARKNEENVADLLPEEYKSEIVKLGRDIREIDEKFAFLGPYSYDSDFIECQVGLNLILTHRFFIGARLCRIREHEGQKRFLETIDQLGIKKSAAYNAIVAAAKFVNDGGEVKYPNLATLGTRKIDTLCILSEDELETLDNGGSVNGLTFEDIKAKTTRELEKERKTWQARAAATERIVEEKSAIIADLQKRLDQKEMEGKPATDWSDRAKDMLTEIAKMIPSVGQYNNRINALADEIKDMPAAEYSKEARTLMAHLKNTVQILYQDFADTMERLDFIEPDVSPHFSAGFNDLVEVIND